MRDFYLPILILLLTFSCGNSVSSKKIEINGSQTDSTVTFLVDSLVTNNKQKFEISAYYHVENGLGKPLYLTNKSIRIHINQPTFLLLANEFQNPYLITPGDTVYISMGNNTPELIMRDTVRQNEFNFFNSLVKQFGNIYYAFKPVKYLQVAKNSVDLHSMEKQISLQVDRRLKYLTEYSEIHRLSSKFQKFASHIISVVGTRDSVQLYLRNKTLITSQNMGGLLLNVLKNNIHNQDFEPYIFDMMLAKEFLVLANSIQKNAILDKPNLNQVLKIINETYSNERRNFLLYSTLSSNISSGYKVQSDVLTSFKKYCTNTHYVKSILISLNKTDLLLEAGAEENIVRNQGTNTIKSFKVILDSLKGNYIFLDFWASWCSPCRTEGKFLKEIKEKFKNYPIEFLSISVDENFDNWLAACITDSLEPSHSFLFLNFDNSPFNRSYDITNVPKFMLLDKTGKVISSDAPKPSDPELYKLLSSKFNKIE